MLTQTWCQKQLALIQLPSLPLNQVNVAGHVERNACLLQSQKAYQPTQQVMVMASACYRAEHPGGRTLKHQAVVNPVVLNFVFGVMTQASSQGSLAGPSWHALLGLAAQDWQLLFPRQETDYVLGDEGNTTCRPIPGYAAVYS